MMQIKAHSLIREEEEDNENEEEEEDHSVASASLDMWGFFRGKSLLLLLASEIAMARGQGRKGFVRSQEGAPTNSLLVESSLFEERANEASAIFQLLRLTPSYNSLSVPLKFYIDLLHNYFASLYLTFLKSDEKYVEKLLLTMQIRSDLYEQTNTMRVDASSIKKPTSILWVWDANQKESCLSSTLSLHPLLKEQKEHLKKERRDLEQKEENKEEEEDESVVHEERRGEILAMSNQDIDLVIKRKHRELRLALFTHLLSAYEDLGHFNLSHGNYQGCVDAVDRTEQLHTMFVQSSSELSFQHNNEMERQLVRMFMLSSKAKFKLNHLDMAMEDLNKAESLVLLHFGDRSVTMANLLIQKADTLQKQGHYEQAIDHYRQGIAIKEVELGYRHPEVGEAIFQLATATQRVPSMVNEAMKLFEKARMIQQQA
jgi:tetratricopeptide (TPR) repeat protein